MGASYVNCRVFCVTFVHYEYTIFFFLFLREGATPSCCSELTLILAPVQANEKAMADRAALMESHS